MNKTRKTLRIDDLPSSDRPRERMATEGVQALTNGELLAILLNSGTTEMSAIDLGNHILNELGGFSGIHREDLSRLLEIKGGLGWQKPPELRQRWKWADAWQMSGWRQGGCS